MMKTVAFGLVQIRCRHRNKCSFVNKLREQNFDNGVTLNKSCAILKILGVKEIYAVSVFWVNFNLYFRYSIHLVDISSLVDPLSNTRTDHSLSSPFVHAATMIQRSAQLKQPVRTIVRYFKGQFSSNLPVFSEVF